MVTCNLSSVLIRACSAHDSPSQEGLGVDKLSLNIVADAAKAKSEKQVGRLLGHHMSAKILQRENDENFIDDPDVPPMM